MALVTTVAVAATATMFEMGISQQKAYAQDEQVPPATKSPCEPGYHWNRDLQTCVANRIGRIWNPKRSWDYYFLRIRSVSVMVLLE
jgi:hypothetical protein